MPPFPINNLIQKSGHPYPYFFNVIVRAPLLKFRVFGAFSREIASTAPFSIKNAMQWGGRPAPIFSMMSNSKDAPVQFPIFGALSRE